MNLHPDVLSVGGCRPGAAPLASSISITPNLGSSDEVFVATGTDVQLEGSAKVRIWFPTCRFVDRDCRAIEWVLFYQPAGVGGVVTNVTSLLLNGPQSNPNSFVAGIPGRFEIVLFCPDLPAQVATRNIFVGSSWKLESTATVWVQNSLVGLNKYEKVAVRAVLVKTPSPDQVLVHLDPITVSAITVTPESADGTFDSTSGVLTLHIVGGVSGEVSGFQVSGTLDITLSTEGNITPSGEAPIRGTTRSSDGTVMLVGDAPVDGPPGTTHAWLQVSGTLTAV